MADCSPICTSGSLLEGSSFTTILGRGHVGDTQQKPKARSEFRWCRCWSNLSTRRAQLGLWHYPRTMTGFKHLQCGKPCKPHNNYITARAWERGWFKWIISHWWFSHKPPIPKAPTQFIVKLLVVQYCIAFTSRILRSGGLHPQPEGAFAPAGVLAPMWQSDYVVPFCWNLRMIHEISTCVS